MKYFKIKYYLQFVFFYVVKKKLLTKNFNTRFKKKKLLSIKLNVWKIILKIKTILVFK